MLEKALKSFQTGYGHFSFPREQGGGKKRKGNYRRAPQTPHTSCCTDGRDDVSEGPKCSNYSHIILNTMH